MILYDSKMPAGYYIGFANEFFTLWHVNQHESTPHGFTKQRCDFIKNISKDKAAAAAAYPDADFTGLKGQSFAWKVPTPINVDDDCFDKGKYFAKKFSEVDDIQYKLWFANENQYSREFLHDELTAAGFVLFCWSDGSSRYLTIEAATIHKKREATVNKYKSGKHLVTFCSNVSTNMTVKIESKYIDEKMFMYGLKLNLAESLDDIISWRSYKGFEYGVVSGFGRTMKQKKALVTISKGYIIKIEER